MLSADVGRRLGEFQLDATLTIADGSVLVLVGESGSGKTTLLRVLAGLSDPDRGRIEVDGQVWFDSASGVSWPPAARSIGYVPQDFALFPHLTAGENVAFGMRAQGLGGSAVA